jgi:hypothetical protein
MRKLIGLVGLLGLTLLLALPAAAQETPKAEVFVGYSLFRPESAGFNQHGFLLSGAGNFNNWLGVAGEFSAHFHKESGVNTNAEILAFGPRFSIRKAKRVTPFIHILFGVARFEVASFNDTGFAMVAGAGLDIKVNDVVALRPVQIDYVLDRVGGSTGHNGRYSAGITFRFGNK